MDRTAIRTTIEWTVAQPPRAVNRFPLHVASHMAAYLHVRSLP